MGHSAVRFYVISLIRTEDEKSPEIFVFNCDGKLEISLAKCHALQASFRIKHRKINSFCFHTKIGVARIKFS